MISHVGNMLIPMMNWSMSMIIQQLLVNQMNVTTPIVRPSDFSPFSPYLTNQRHIGNIQNCGWTKKKTDFGWFSLTIMTLVGTFCCKSPARIMATCAPQREPHDASDFVGHREDHPIAQCLGAWWTYSWHTKAKNTTHGLHIVYHINNIIYIYMWK